MKKTTKGVIAVSAAIALLLGAGGTLTYWNDTANLGGSNTITAGTLTVVADGTPTWAITHTSGAQTTVADISAVRIVPGDVLTYTMPATITAQGQNLRFQVGLAGGSVAAPGGTAADTALAGRLAASAVFGVTGATPVGTGGDTFEHKSNASDSYATTITATITWPFGAAESPTQDNPAKTGSVDLSGFALTVTQVDGSITVP